MKKIILMLLVLTALVGCVSNEDNSSSEQRNKSIVILYENDVHCGIDGYTQMRGLRDAIVRSDTSFVGMVSAGDFLQGDLAGAISLGQFVVDIMKNMGYDAVTLGNHEFDYGVERMQELLPQIKTTVVCTNFVKFGETTPLYQPYVIKQYGKKRIAFVGTTTPETMRSEAYSFFDKDQKQIYDLQTTKCYSLVQQAVDNARSEGADYVVVLSHLGEATSDTGINSHGLVAATRGIEATGEQLLAMLTKCTAKCPEADGSFPQVSGMKFTIHTASHKVTDVQILDADTYKPLDLQGKYTIAVNDYYNNGGFYRTLQDCRVIRMSEILSRDALSNYLENVLSGVVPDSYKEPQGRVTIVND